MATDRDAPRGKLVAIGLAAPQPAAWKPLIAEGPNRDVLDAVTMLGDRFVVTWQIDARHALRVYDLRGALEREIALPTLGSVSFSSHRRDREGFYSFTSFTYPSAVYRYDPAAGASAPFRTLKLAFTPSDFETTQVFYTSQGRHEGPDVHHRPQGLRARRQGADDPLRLRRLQHLADAGLLGRHGRLAGAGRRSTPSPTCAAAASTARPGTTPAGCSTSRTSSTTSSPPPST